MQKRGDTNMKSRFRMLLTAITFIAGLALLFAALALPLRLAAQHNPDITVYRGYCQYDYITGRLTGLCHSFRFQFCYLQPSADCIGTVNPPRNIGLEVCLVTVDRVDI